MISILQAGTGAILSSNSYNTVATKSKWKFLVAEISTTVFSHRLVTWHEKILP